ncbi:MAG: nucleotidyltransferase family protein [Haloechinothrix sp.]
MTVGGLLLAAGAGRRFGGPKALAVFKGTTLLERGIALLRAGGCEPIHVVLGAETAELNGVMSVLNPEWASGMGSSLRVGLSSLPEGVDAVVVALVDQPLIGAEAIRRLRAAHAGGAAAAVATYAGEPRNPVLLDRSLWDAVATEAVGDTGARRFLNQHPEVVTAVPCDDTGSPSDIDTQDDLAAMEGNR